MALHSLLDDWGLPQALFQLVLALPVFAAVESRASTCCPGVRSRSFSRWREASAMAGGRERKCASKR